MPKLFFNLGELMALMQSLEHFYASMPANPLCSGRKDTVKVLHDRLELAFAAAAIELATWEEAREGEELVEVPEEAPETG